MRLLSLYAGLAALLFFTACKNEQAPAAEEKTTTTESAAAPAATNIDPVCDMPYEASWTDYTVHAGDTVHFCSETCKKAFEGNPQKYVAKLSH